MQDATAHFPVHLVVQFVNCFLAWTCWWRGLILRIVNWRFLKNWWFFHSTGDSTDSFYSCFDWSDFNWNLGTNEAPRVLEKWPNLKINIIFITWAMVEWWAPYYPVPSALLLSKMPTTWWQWGEGDPSCFPCVLLIHDLIFIPQMFKS